MNPNLPDNDTDALNADLQVPIGALNNLLSGSEREDITDILNLHIIICLLSRHARTTVTVAVVSSAISFTLFTQGFEETAQDLRRQRWYVDRFLFLLMIIEPR